jgi:putative transposase
MILTYKIKHGKDFSDSLIKARKVAQFAIENKFNLSSASVKQIGLKSIISNQILRKYGKNRKIKKVKSVKLTIPSQGISFDKTKSELNISCVNLKNLKYYFDNNFDKINQIEIDKTYCYVSVSYTDKPLQMSSNYIGIDLNTTGHCAVIGNPKTGKIIKLGKNANHIHQKYKNTRKQLQKQGKFGLVKKTKNRESRIIKDLNHKISKKIVNEAIKHQCNIKMEDLNGIRKNKKNRKSFRYALNSWSFYQLRQMIEYKAKKQGVIVTLIDPSYTSKTCSKCGALGERNGKTFKCSCGHVDHADSNAAFNICVWSQGMGLLTIDRDVVKGSTDTPKKATLRMQETLEPQVL